MPDGHDGEIRHFEQVGVATARAAAFMARGRRLCD